MIYRQFKDKSISLLGFGAMRLPVKEDGSIDEALTEIMVDTAVKEGVNYFDTAWPYHSGASETVMGRILKKYPRESYFLATKYPGHHISSTYEPAKIFEAQLKKCGVEYFDFYLLHNVYENSMDVYLDPKWGIIDYFKEQKRLGRIKHLGFSSHAELSTLKQFVETCGEDMEFCQIQLNYLDWSLQQAKEKYEYLTEKGIPVWVMEPVRGGKLADLGAENEKLKALRPEDSVASWCFRFLQDLPNVGVILSGMSDRVQTEDNLRTFRNEKPLSAEEKALLLEIAEKLKDSVPCTACRYCVDGCPMGLDIPRFIAILNELRYAPITNTVMRMDSLPDDKKPSACIACGKCSQICPQGIDIPRAMAELTDAVGKVPSWKDVCRERDAAQK